MSLTPEQRDNLRRLLAHELRTAWHTALDGGASPAALADLVDERRRAMDPSDQDDGAPRENR